jgi:hypothetical protein
MNRTVSFTLPNETEPAAVGLSSPVLVIIDGPHRLTNTSPIAINPSTVEDVAREAQPLQTSPFDLAEWERASTT